MAKSPTIQPLCFQPALSELLDIVSQVQIETNFWITHPHYPPLELAAEAVERFRQLPLALQHKYLSLQLRNFLYDIFYSGPERINPIPAINTAALPPEQPLQNNRMRGLNLEFFQQLHDSNAGKGFFEPGWRVLQEESDGTLAVKKQGLTLHIDRDLHLQPVQQSAPVGTLVAVRMPRNRVEAGFYIAVGNAGLVGGCDRQSEPQAVDLYFNVGSAGAIALMQAITSRLNAINIPFTFKVLSDPADYGRADAGVLCCQPKNYAAVRQVLQTIYTQNRAHFQPSVPLFSKLLAPGLGLAESPEDINCFGLHRCQLVANGLLAAWQNGDSSPIARMNFICQEFSRHGIDWQSPYLNPGSDDTYTPWNL